MPHLYRWIPAFLIALFGCGGSDAPTGTAGDAAADSVGADTAGTSLVTTRDAAADSAGADTAGTSLVTTRDAAADSGGADVAYGLGDAASGTADSAGTGSTGMLPCSALQPLADLPVLGSWRTHYAYYAQDRSWLLLQVRGDNDSLVRVDLPSGKTTTIVDRLNAAWPLGSKGTFLLRGTGSNGDDISVYDGKEVRKILSGLCNFQPTPDGTRLYATCAGDGNGLQAIDVATGEVSIVDKSATMATVWSIAVSPNGQWVAYRTGESNRTIRTITLASVAGRSYTITSAQAVESIEFGSDDLLVFHTAGDSATDGDLRGHVPGSGDTSFLVVSDDYSYRFSLDRTRVAVAKFNRPLGSSRLASLYSIPSQGGDPLLLVKDWSIPYSDMLYAFDFDSQGNYALYVSLSGYDSANLPTYTVSVVDMKGSKPRKLSNGWGFGRTSATSSVLLYDTADDGRYRLRLTDLATGVDRFSYSSNQQIVSANALRGDQAVLFAETDGAKRGARFMSASYPQSTVLGVWEELDYRGASPMPVQPDPTGCFTVVNTDLSPGPGTRLVLLPD
jgi:hypothetical protein